MVDHSGVKKMGKAKDSISWFGEKGNDGAEVVKMAGTAIVTVGAVVIAGAVLGTVGKMFGGE